MFKRIRFTNTTEANPVIYKLAKTVLIVDSNPAKAEHIEGFIRELHHVSLGIVDNVVDLEQKIKKQEPDMVFINLQTKGQMDGFQIAKFLKLDYDIPYAIYFDDAPKLEKLALELNPDHIIKCNFDNESLREKIDDSLH